MPPSPQLAAQLIRSSRSGLTGIIASDLMQRLTAAPRGDGVAYGDDGFQRWSSAVSQRLAALATALDDDDPERAYEDARWLVRISSNRGVPQEDLVALYDCMDAVLRERLPEGLNDTVHAYLARARAALAEPVEWNADLEPGTPAAELFDLIVCGDRPGAYAFLAERAARAPAELSRLVDEVVVPVAVEVGDRWHAGRLGVAAEHVATHTLRAAVNYLAGTLEPSPSNGRAVLIAAAEGDAHDTALVALALLFERDGWRVVFTGADTPTEEIDETAATYDCDVIALSATIASQRHAIAGYLKDRKRGLPVLVGGSSIRDAADAERLGADGYAAKLSSAVTRARELVGLPEA